MKKIHILIVLLAWALASCNSFSRPAAESESVCCSADHDHDHSAHANQQESFTIGEDGDMVAKEHSDCDHDHAADKEQRGHVHTSECNHIH